MVRETRHLWVGNLPDNVREERIREHFQRYSIFYLTLTLCYYEPICVEPETPRLSRGRQNLVDLKVI